MLYPLKIKNWMATSPSAPRHDGVDDLIITAPVMASDQRERGHPGKYNWAYAKKGLAIFFLPMPAFARMTTGLICLLTLSGCDTFRNTLGLDHYQPDEFQVAGGNPPLSMPPNYNLRPPSPNTPDSTAQGPNVSTQQAQKTLTGKTAPSTTPVKDKTSQTLVNEAAGGQAVDPHIREVVDKEAESQPKTSLDAKLEEIKKNATSLGGNKPDSSGEKASS